MSAAGTRMPWHPVPRRAASAVLAVRLFTTCSLPIKLRLAYILCYFIRNRRCSYIVCIGFTNAEYHVIRVDFIVALRRTKGRGRRTLRSPPSPWNHACVVQWTPPHPPGVNRCGGAFWLPRAYRDIGFRYPVLSLLPSFECCAAICVRLCIVRVSVDFVGLESHVFHWWWIDCSFLRLRWILLFLS